MKSFDRLIMVVLGVMIGITAIFNLLLPQLEAHNERLYVIEINRFMALHVDDFLTTTQSGHPFMTTSETLNGIRFFYIDHDDALLPDIFTNDSGRYTIRPHFVDDNLIGFFQFELTDIQSTSTPIIKTVVNGILFLIVMMVLGILIYIRQQIIIPFSTISHLPIELSQGNVKKGIPESKSRYFGNFIWGLNMMRETLAAHKKRELELLKDHKTMILAISHDMNTPLSTIKLSIKALSVGLYPDPNKQQEILTQVSHKIVEIENFVADIAKTSKENLLTFEVKKQEFYLADVVDKVVADYSELLALRKTKIVIDDFSNRLLLGDFQRLIEVMQNLMENAMKYGDKKQVRLSFTVEEEYHLITISNTGNTLPDKELIHVFESFWRGSNVGAASGNGLGLHISRTLMRQMGGEIYAQIVGDEFFITVVIAI